MRLPLKSLLAWSLLLAAAPLLAAPPAPPPLARSVEVTETRFGVTVADPYRWMEGTENPERDAWLRAQGAYARAWLDALPVRAGIHARIRELGLGTGAIGGLQLAGGRQFYLWTAPGAQLPVLKVQDEKGERVLVDPATLSQGSRHASVHAFAPSPDGTLLAYDLALGGSEVSTLHVLNVATGKVLPDAIEGIWGEFAASWLPDGKAFTYTQMTSDPSAKDPMLDMRARLHVLGTSVERDVTLLDRMHAGGLALAPEEFPQVQATPGSRWLVAFLGGARAEVRVAVAPLSKLDRKGAGRTPWREVARYQDEVSGGVVNGERLYLDSFHGASTHRVLSVPLAEPDLAKARLELPDRPDSVLEGIQGAKDGLFARYRVEGKANLVRLAWGGEPVTVPLPYPGWIDDYATDPLRDGAWFELQGWTRAPAYFAVDRSGKMVPTPIAATTIADFSGIEVVAVEARSADGTLVPMTILQPRGLALDGSHPALLYGYGGYGISMTPAFNPSLLPWLERGGVWAVCHVRGGGEKGEAWHRDGIKEKKLNGIHDFEACGQALVDRALTTRARLFGRAGSMGGVLIGRTLTDRPDLFAAANIAVGMNNPLRLLEGENGANQKGELGDPETEAGFRAIEAMDPYQHVVPAPYPAVILTAGLNDRRVPPWETAKMAARLQAATTSGRPILVRLEEDAGHGIGSTRDQRYSEQADVYSFFLAAAGLTGP